MKCHAIYVNKLIYWINSKMSLLLIAFSLGVFFNDKFSRELM